MTGRVQQYTPTGTSSYVNRKAAADRREEIDMVRQLQ